MPNIKSGRTSFDRLTTIVTLLGGVGENECLKATLSTCEAEIAHLRTARVAMPRGITGMKGLHGSYHYFLNLIFAEALMVVASWQGVLHHGIVDIT